ncbi:hypothetical protein [Streptomyces sp. NPDC047009]|uniref:hypothetical protein n=1 Tax=unclassified Streptomyces TaxID=2593676 RepID=UPI0033D89E96
MPSFEITPIGTIRDNRTDVQYTDNWGAVRSTITIDERFGEACLQGLQGFSHVEVLFVLDQFPEQDDYREPRPYRGRSDLPPVGVFAGHGPRRGELTDWVELRLAETDQAETHMITAAREWLTVAGDREAEAQYFDRWLHDILGYERQAPPQAWSTILKTVVARVTVGSNSTPTA